MVDEPVDRGREARVLRYLERWGPLTARAVADDHMLDSEAVERLLDALERRGRIRIGGEDRYGKPRYAT